MEGELIREIDGKWYIKFKDPGANIRMNEDFEYIAELAYQKGLKEQNKD